MLTYLWREWWRDKERFLILLLGISIISSGLVLLYHLSESNKGTIMNTVQQKWKVSYDILVRPPGSQLTDPQNKLIEPNIQSGISGGITLEQWERIKDIPGVDIAAPLSLLGYVNLNIVFPEKATIDEPGVYRKTMTATAYNGIQDQNAFSYSSYFVRGPWHVENNASDAVSYGISTYSNDEDLIMNDLFLMAGIDPTEEARLVGLDHSVQNDSGSRYYKESDASRIVKHETNPEFVELPVLMSTQNFTDKTYQFQFERLDLPFSDKEQASRSMESVKANGGRAYLDKLRPVAEKTYTFRTEQVQEKFTRDRSIAFGTWHVLQKATPLVLDPIANAYPDRWPYSYQAQRFSTPEIYQWFTSDVFRPYEEYERKVSPGSWMNGYFVKPNFIGFYDPLKLQMAMDPLAELPMDTYRPPSAKLLFDGAMRPLNPPATLKPVNNPLGLLTSPPTMLTTIEAAANILTDKPISVIRIKAAGLSEVSEDSQKKLEQIASEIREQTGLEADIVFGSSPQPVLIHVPASGSTPALGWLEQQWIKLGTKFVIVKEMQIGFSGMLLLVNLMAVLYVAATNLVSFLVRKQHFALMLSTGWRPAHIIRLIVLENIIIGVFVAFLIWSLQGAFVFLGQSELSLTRFAVTGLAGFAIYGLGGMPVLLLVRRITPMEAIRSGEISTRARRLTKVRGVFHVALSHFAGKLKRNTLAVLSIAMPTTLLMFFLFVTVRLKGVFYSSWFGQYAVGAIGSSHYWAIGICLLIALFTTAEIIWQNVSERKQEIALLQALGWRSNPIRRLVLAEGFLTGCCAGVVAGIAGFLILTAFYREFPVQDLWYLGPLAAVPVLTGTIGAWLPAEKAVRLSVKKGLAGNYSTHQKTERRMKGALIAIAGMAVLLAAFSVFHMVSIRQPSVVTKQSLALAPAGSPMYSAGEIGDITGFVPQFVSQGSHAVYDLSLQMVKKGVFTASATVTATNASTDKWDKMVFYMIPNVFTEPQNKQTYRKSAEFSIEELRLNGKPSNFQLEGDTLTLPLPQKLAPNGQAVIELRYRFKVPEDGIRFTQVGGTSVLAQWYPMLATYHQGWNKEPYNRISESYHTDFSDFTLHYDLPEGMELITSSGQDPGKTAGKGKLRGEHIKELLIAVTDDMTAISKQQNNMEIRVWGRKADQNRMKEALELAADAMEVFNTRIGPYPHKQVDLILNETGSMEYPGVVTVGISGEVEMSRHAIVHELAHQWFYGVVSSDPYHEGWLDEGMTELATSLFLNDFSYAEQHYRPNFKASNLPLPEYQDSGILNSLYAQPTIRFKELLDTFDDGREKGFDFLHAYWTTYRNHQLDTREFVRFTKAFFKMENDDFFEWLKLD